MIVNLKCVFGDKHPNNNPHEIEDKIAKNLIENDLAEDAKSAKTGNKEVAELEAKLAEKDEEIAELVDIVIETSKLAKDKLPNSFSKYQGEDDGKN